MGEVLGLRLPALAALALLFAGEASAQAPPLAPAFSACSVATVSSPVADATVISEARLQELLLTPPSEARGRSLLLLGAAALNVEPGSIAIRALRASADDAARLADTDTRAAALGLLGRLAARGGDRAEAVRLFDSALAVSEIGAKGSAGFLWQADLACMSLADGNLASALAHYERAYRAFGRARASQTLDAHPLGEKWVLADATTLVSGYIDILLRSDSATETLLKARAAIETLYAIELQRVEDICVTEPAIDIVDPSALPVQTAVIYPITFNSRVELLVLYRRDGQGLTIDRIPAALGATDIATLATRLNLALRDRGSFAYKKIAKDLHSAIIAPMGSLLTREHIGTLVFAPEGALRGVPLAALHDGEKFLVESFAIATISGLNVAAPKPLESRQPRMLLAGLAKSGSEAVDDLENVDAEVDDIANLAKAGRAFLLKNEEFSKSRLEAELSRSNYGIVHLATHASFGQRAEDSSLRAYGGEQISIDNLAGMMNVERVQGAPIELLMLSACETAAGDDQAVLGIAGAAFNSGARSVVATLWSVNDPATAELAPEFYRGLLEQNLSRAEALRRAQLRLIRQGKHPYYWAAFILIGNWL